MTNGIWKDKMGTVPIIEAGFAPYRARAFFPFVSQAQAERASFQLWLVLGLFLQISVISPWFAAF